MYSRVVLIIVHIAAVFISSCECQDDGIRISLGDREFPNHGLVTTEDIGVDRLGMRLGEGLKCSTTYEQCCTGSSVTTLTASWHHGHTASLVQLSNPSIIDPFAFGMRRTGQAVYLFRNKVLTNPTVSNGIWRCTIPDQNGVQQTKYIGIYANGTTGALSAGTPSTIQFSIVNENPVVFRLTFKTTGGPATMVTWTRDSDDISSLEDSHLYTPSQLVVPNGRLYTAGDYSNILTVSGRLPGVYGVSVTNDRTTTPVTPTRNIIIIDFAHSNISLNVARSQELTSISVSWTLVNSSFMEYFSLYEVQYTVCHIWSGHCETVQSQRINDFATTQYTVSDLALWTNYSFTVLAEFDTPTVNESTHILPTPVSTGYHTITILGVLAPEITSVIELANITSVQVTWNQPKGGLVVDEYVVSYRRLNGRNGQCSSFQDEGSLSVRAEANTTALQLQGYSVYVVSVTGRSIGASPRSNTSSTFQFETNSSVPSGAPQNLNIINSTSTSVTISWDSVECIHRNGLIAQYIISYEPIDDNSLATIETVNNNEPDGGGRFTATEILSTKIYFFKVAAVNAAGVGVFATVSQNKDVLAPEITSVIELANITSVQVTWNQPEGGLVVDEYVVSYRRLNGRDEQCSSFQDGGSVSVRARGEGLLYTSILHLQAYSVYAVNVTGRSGTLNSTSITVQFATNSTIPSGAPQNLAIINSNSTSVFVSWDSVECIHRNGLIIHYLLVYEPVDTCGNSLATITTVNSDESDDGGSYLATGLDPSSSYLFKVAAVNNIGIGPFSTVQTKKGTSGKCSTCSASVTAATAGMATVIVILMLIIAVLSGAIIAFWVCRTRGNLPKDKQPHTEDSTEMQNKANEALYDEIHISSEPPKTSIELETCPAYEVTKTR